MKNKIKIVLLILIPVLVFSQENENSNFNQYSSSIFRFEGDSFFLVSNLNQQSKVLNNNLSEINIQQIGDFNIVNSNIKSDKINVSIYQNGINNSIDSYKNALEVNQNFSQTGDNNLISDLTYYTPYSVNMEIIQDGNNQSVQNIGTNSLSKDLKITQTGIGTSVIIINQ